MREDQSQDIKKVRRSNGGRKIRVEVSTNKRSETETKHVSLPDLNHLGKAHDETKTSPKRRVPLFDLNQISVSTYIFHFCQKIGRGQREQTCIYS